MSELLLDVRDLRVHFPSFSLGPVSFAVGAGERVALLGANGAGKTTLLRALTGRLAKREGSALIMGRDLRQAPASWFAHVGYAAESPPADPVLRVSEWFDFLADVHPTWSRDDQVELVTRLGVDVARKIGQLSRGTLVKVALITAEAARPPLLVLDEPTNGLDPVVRQELVTLLRERFVPGGSRSLLFSSHLLEDVEALCDRALMIRGGRLVREVSGDLLRQARADGQLTGLVADVLTATEENCAGRRRARAEPRQAHHRGRARHDRRLRHGDSHGPLPDHVHRGIHLAGRGSGGNVRRGRHGHP
ncbi:MAG TPA: ABC transporter ATP-binding protein [Gemmatimonadales bacterium]|nr:ABC transporter ATP-binding protein [Gemmatimonadales bacterium]